MHYPQDDPGHRPPQECPPPRNGREVALRVVFRHARRLIVLVLGTTVLLFGVVLLVTPGPAFIVIPIGLAILGLEFAWARRVLRRVKQGVQTGIDWKDGAEWMWMAGLRKQRRRAGKRPDTPGD